MLAFRIAADDIAVMADDAIAEEAGSGLVLAVAGQFVEAREADQLGDLGVGVEPGQLIVPGGEGIENLAIVDALGERSEEHTSELQSLMRISYAVFCLKKKKTREVTDKL